MWGYLSPALQSKEQNPPNPPTVAPWPSPAHAGVGNTGERVKAEFNKVFKPTLSSGDHRSSQFREPHPVPPDRLIHTSGPATSNGRLEISEFTDRASRAILAGAICATRALQIQTSSIYITFVSEVNDSQLHKVLFKITVQLVPKKHGSIRQLEFSLRKYNYKHESSYLQQIPEHTLFIKTIVRFV